MRSHSKTPPAPAGTRERRRMDLAAKATAGAATEPQVQGVLLLGEDPDGDVQAEEQRIERIAEQPAPMLSDIAQLADERRGRGARGRAHELDRSNRHPARVGRRRRRPAPGRRSRPRTESHPRGSGRPPARAGDRGPGSRSRSASGGAPPTVRRAAPDPGRGPGTRIAYRSRSRSASGPSRLRTSWSASVIAAGRRVASYRAINR